MSRSAATAGGRPGYPSSLHASKARGSGRAVGGSRRYGAGASSGAGAGSGLVVDARRKDVTAAKVAKGAEDSKADATGTIAIRKNMTPTDFGHHRICVHSKIGRRKYQEDRYVMVPKLAGREDTQFYGVFDGTVGDFASDFVHNNIVRHLMASKAFKETQKSTGSEYLSDANIRKFDESIKDMYRTTDAELIEKCREHALHYSSSTSVAALITGNVLTVGHLADSRIVLGREVEGMLVGKMLTHDHKPDQPKELARIEASGGSLTYLHGGKPFIRGGDFVERQARGERPMQLNYSRAFGGKDLKMFGLSSVPDVSQFRLDSRDKLLILASDGLWDVVDGDTAVQRAWEVAMAGGDPSRDLVDFALAEHDIKGTIDNVTVMVVMFR